MRQQVEETPVGAVGPRLDRSEGDPKLLGDLDMGQTVEMTHLDDLAFLVAEPLERRTDFEHLPDRVERRVEHGFVDTVVCERSGLLAVDVDRAASGNRVEPWREVSVGIETTGPPPSVDESLLGGVGRQSVILEDPQRDGVDRAPIPLVDALDRALLPCSKLLEEVAIHTRILTQREPLAGLARNGG